MGWSLYSALHLCWIILHLALALRISKRTRFTVNSKVHQGLSGSFWQCWWEVYMTSLDSWAKTYPVTKSMGTIDQIKEWVQPCHWLKINTQELQRPIVRDGHWESEEVAANYSRKPWAHIPFLLFMNTVALGWFPFYIETVSLSIKQK